MAGEDGRAAGAALSEARALAQAGRLAEAVRAARQAAQADPAQGEAFAIWGLAAAELGDFSEAVEPLMAAAARAPRGSMGWTNVASQLARALANLGFWGDAFRWAEAVERLDPPDVLARQRIGAAFARMNRFDRGLPQLLWAEARAPAWHALRLELGVALMSEGRFDEAEERLEKAIALAPRAPHAHMALAELRRWSEDTAHLARLRALMADPEVPPADRARLGFALFKELDDLDRREEAWAVLEAANQGSRADVDAWSAAEDAALVDALVETFPAARFAGGGAADPAGAVTPIFVVGLPRSGTTLVERILAAHPQVQAMGELPTFPILFRRAAVGVDRRRLNAATVRATRGADWRATGGLYLQEVRTIGGQGPFVVDKLPVNGQLVGAIRLAFPHARIVHVRRDPMDALFGAYKVRFAGLWEWSYDQQDLAAHYANHRRLMRHWRDTLGEGLIEVGYEALAADPAPQIRRLLDACGLAFDPACLEPHKAAGPVRTASIAQVRQPINAGRIGAWRRYEAQLAPLRAALEALGDAGG